MRPTWSSSSSDSWRTDRACGSSPPASVVRSISLTLSALAERRRQSSLDGSGSCEWCVGAATTPREVQSCSVCCRTLRYALRLLRRQPGFSLLRDTDARGRYRRKRRGLQRGERRAAEAVAVRTRAIGWSPSGDASIPRAASPSRSFRCPIPSSSTTGRKPMPCEDAAAWSRAVGDRWRSGRGARAGRGRSVSANLFSLLRVSPSAGPNVHERGGPSESASRRRALDRLLAEPLCRRPVGRGTDSAHEWCPDHDRRHHA